MQTEEILHKITKPFITAGIYKDEKSALTDITLDYVSRKIEQYDNCVFRRKLPPIPEITLPLIPSSNSLVECNTIVAGLRQLFGYIFLRESPSNSTL